MLFRQAERKKAKLRLGMSGPSGGGKTWSALEIAFGMTTGDKIFFIDTESGRGELYQGAKSKHDPKIVFNYNYYRLDAPYSPERYIEAIKNAEAHGCEVLIIDSLSHAWAGEGGVLSIVDKAGGQFQKGWQIGTPKQNALIDTIITSKMHMIVNLRAKTEYVIEKNEHGKNAPRKIGLAPIQRDQLEYEFTVFMSMSHDNIAHVTKDNSGLYHQEFITPTPMMGTKLIEWLNSGSEALEDQVEEITETNSVNALINLMIDRINEITSEDELKTYFMDCYRKYAKYLSGKFDLVVDAKDMRKKELSSEHIAELADIEDMVMTQPAAKQVVNAYQPSKPISPYQPVKLGAR